MKTVLLVDDSKAVRLVARRTMTALGLLVLEAEHGQKAFEVVQDHPEIDVILLDWNMPIMDGLEFLQALRAADLERQPIVVMCTTENDMPRIVQAMQAGANEYIMKPFTEDIVRDKFEEAGVL
jgi:two-component system chemotaxis response regulator CheY